MTNEPINPDEQPIFDALLEAGVKPRGAYTAVRRVRELAAHNIVTLIESKFDAVNSQFDAVSAQLEALHRENATTRRWLAFGLSGLGIMIAVLRFLD